MFRLVSENEVPAGFSLCYINQLSEYVSEVPAIFMPQFHTQSKKAYQLVTGRYFTSQLLPVQPKESQNQCFVRFSTHAQTAALELLLFPGKKKLPAETDKRRQPECGKCLISVAFFPLSLVRDAF